MGEEFEMPFMIDLMSILKLTRYDRESYNVKGGAINARIILPELRGV